MDLFKEWETLNQTKFNNNNLTDQEIMDAITHQSHAHLGMLKKGLKTKMYWIFLFMAVSIVFMLFSLHNTELLMILGASLIVNIAFLLPILLNYKRIQNHSFSEFNTSQAIKSQINIIKRVLRLQFIVGLFAMPGAVIKGLLISNNLRGHSIADAMHNSHLLTTALIGLLVFVPLAIMAAMKMNASVFGKHLSHLQENATRLEILEP